MPLLVWIVSNAVAAGGIDFGCPNPPCKLGLASFDHNIVPPDRLRVVEAEIAPIPLEWFEVTLTTHSGEVEVTIDGITLDPRAGIEDARAGTIRWVVRAGDISDGIAVDVYNASRTEEAEYELIGLVLVEHQ